MLEKSVQADRFERTRKLPGDELLPNSIDSATHAVTIARPRRNVWPWLAQMGAGRAGWYSYDFIDNGGRRSAENLVPEFQEIRVGTLMPALPGATDGFIVAGCEPERSLVLGWPSRNGTFLTTWAFVLEQFSATRTRLIVRSRVGPGYRFFGVPLSIARPLVLLGQFIMERRQLLGIARRAEALDRSAAAPMMPQTTHSARRIAS